MSLVNLIPMKTNYPSNKIEINELIIKAENGNAELQYQLGEKYKIGDGTEINYGQAMKWYHLSAKQGLAKAQFQLGLSYQYGFESNPTYPISLFSKSDVYTSDYEVDSNIFSYGQKRGVQDNFEQAIYWYQLASDQGFAEAQYKLGLFYNYQVMFQRSHTKAVKYIQLAAEQGLAKAQDALSLYYESGIGCEKNLDEGRKWAQLAADQGYLKSILHMASLYYRGKGVAKSKSESLKWYKIAAEQGHDDAQSCVEQLEDELNTISRKSIDKGL